VSKIEKIKRRPRIGSIIKITKFGGWFDDLDGEKEYIWATVCEHDHDDQHISYVRFLSLSFKAAYHHGGDDYDKWPVDEYDNWRVVSPSKVPDYVWVEAAKRALLCEGD